jgi:hypothetical protein
MTMLYLRTLEVLLLLVIAYHYVVPMRDDLKEIRRLLELNHARERERQPESLSGLLERTNELLWEIKDTMTETDVPP